MTIPRLVEHPDGLSCIEAVHQESWNFLISPYSPCFTFSALFFLLLFKKKLLKNKKGI
jgi:hypothetical protein